MILATVWPCRTKKCRLNLILMSRESQPVLFCWLHKLMWWPGTCWIAFLMLKAGITGRSDSGVRQYFSQWFIQCSRLRFECDLQLMLYYTCDSSLGQWHCCKRCGSVFSILPGSFSMRGLAAVIFSGLTVPVESENVRKGILRKGIILAFTCTP